MIITKNVCVAWTYDDYPAKLRGFTTLGQVKVDTCEDPDKDSWVAEYQYYDHPFANRTTIPACRRSLIALSWQLIEGGIPAEQIKTEFDKIMVWRDMLEIGFVRSTFWPQRVRSEGHHEPSVDNETR